MVPNVSLATLKPSQNLIGPIFSSQQALVTLCEADRHSERTKPHVGTSACFLHAHWSRCKIIQKKGKPKACSSPVTLQGNSNYTENTLSLPPTFSTPHRRNKPRGRTRFPVPLFVSTFSRSVLTFQFRKASASQGGLGLVYPHQSLTSSKVKCFYARREIENAWVTGRTSALLADKQGSMLMATLG